jgi:alkanesulfonate monooxygenase SsuD/methylene tetrahydromethanopterin reductase-like flavin-dependent oxidoreductase (luciferase family)
MNNKLILMISQKNIGFALTYDYISPSLCHDLLHILDNTSFTHLFIPELWGYDAFTQIAMMSRYSSKLIFGTGIVNIYSRTPATLAQSAASLHEATEGRFILGIGLSGPIVIRDWHGVNYYQYSPLQRTREYLEILRLIFSGEKVNYNSGKIFSLKGFKLKSFDTPLNIPLFLAALGPKNIQLAGELADGWFPIWTPFSQFSLLKRDLDHGMMKRSKKLNKKVQITPYIITCASKSEKAKKLVQNHIAYYIGGMGTFYYNFMKRLGFEAESERIKNAWDSGNKYIAAKAVSQDMIDEIAVLGPPEDVLSRYVDLRKLGVNLPIVMLPYNCPSSLAIETIGVFAE